MKFTGTWTARVEQDFEIEADSEVEFRELIQGEIHPTTVVELLDIQYEYEQASE